MMSNGEVIPHTQKEMLRWWYRIGEKLVGEIFTIIQSEEIEKAKEALARDLPALRAMIGITQEELCQTIGITRQTYSSIENMKKSMSQSTFISLLLYFYVNERTRDLLEQTGAFTDHLKNICQYDGR